MGTKERRIPGIRTVYGTQPGGAFQIPVSQLLYDAFVSKLFARWRDRSWFPVGK